MYGIQRSASPLVKPHNFMHSDDYLVLEDESGRVKLGGTYLLPSVYVTGKLVFDHEIWICSKKVISIPFHYLV